MKIKLVVCGIFLAVGMTGLLTACEKEGPMEKAGESLDEAAEETKEEVQQLKEKAEDTMNN